MENIKEFGLSVKEKIERIAFSLGYDIDVFPVTDKEDAQFIDDGSAHILRNGQDYCFGLYNNGVESWSVNKERNALNKIVQMVDSLDDI